MKPNRKKVSHITILLWMDQTILNFLSFIHSFKRLTDHLSKAKCQMSNICKTSLENKEVQYKYDQCHSREILKWCRAAKTAFKETSALGLEKSEEVIIMYSVKIAILNIQNSMLAKLMYILLIINYTGDAWLEELSIYLLVILYSFNP